MWGTASSCRYQSPPHRQLQDRLPKRCHILRLGEQVLEVLLDPLPRLLDGGGVLCLGERVQGGVAEADAGSGSREMSLLQGRCLLRQLVDLGDDAVLLGEGGEGDAGVTQNHLIDVGLCAATTKL